MAGASVSLETNRIRWAPWVRFARWVVGTTPIVWLLFVVLLGSAVAGYLYWYGDSLQAAPWYLWLFVPDSPLSVTLMAIVLLALYYGRGWEFLGLVASGASMKYGLWTVLVWFTNYLSGGRYHFMAILMSATHFGMIVLGLVVTVFLRFRPILVLIVSLFLIANDVIDYGFGYHPPVPNPEDLTTIARFSVATTVVLVLFWIVMAWLTWRSRGGERPGRRSNTSQAGGPSGEQGAA
ncbi:MAG: DUF1405 domain-containing protein [Thermoleophilia bacterium]|nr:DUF1405 domain-containing protein [Thermoleophilia bacterium]